MEYKKKAHSVYLMTYHLVFVTKYRKPVISNEIGEFMKELSREICEQHGGTLISAETNTDHMHLLISMPPQERPSDIIRVLKTQTSKKVIHHRRAFLIWTINQHTRKARIRSMRFLERGFIAAFTGQRMGLF